jgi:hypothetical protein
VVVARLLRDLVIHGPARSLEIEHRNHCVEQRYLDPLAFAGLLALEQRGENAQRAIQACRRIGDSAAGAHRAASRLAGNRHQSAHALRHLIEAGALGVWAGLTKSGNAGEDDFLVDQLQRLVIDAETELDVRPEVFSDHIRAPDELFENFQSIRVFQVQREAALVAMQILEVGAGALAAPAVGHVQPRRRLDLDHIRAPVGELAHRRRAGTHPRQVDDTEAGQRAAALCSGVIAHDFSLQKQVVDPEPATTAPIRRAALTAPPIFA